jgi:hypothetical protein
MTWNDDLERRHYERMEQEQQKSGAGAQYDPWQMEKVLFNKGETFYMRVLRPVDGAVHRRKYHWPAGGLPIECTEDHPAFFDKGLNKGRCSLCTIFPDKKDRAKQKKEDVLEVIDFRFFHIIPDEKKGGDRETIERCTHDEPDSDIRENRCHLCNSDSERVNTRYFGGHKVLELKGYQYEQVWAAHEKLTHTCISVLGQEADGSPVICGKKNYILAFVCRHCEELVLDEKTAKKMAPLAKAKFKAAKQICKNCNKADYPYPIYSCESGTGRSQTPSEQRDNIAPDEGEHWVVRGSMFDKVLEVTIAGQEKYIKGQKDPIVLKNLNISTGEAWSSITDDLLMFGFTEEQVVKFCEPWDLSHRYRPSFKLKPDDYPDNGAWEEAVLREQAEAVNRPYPFGEGSGDERSFKSSGGRRSFRS